MGSGEDVGGRGEEMSWRGMGEECEGCGDAFREVGGDESTISVVMMWGWAKLETSFAVERGLHVRRPDKPPGRTGWG